MSTCLTSADSRRSKTLTPSEGRLWGGALRVPGLEKSGGKGGGARGHWPACAQP